MTDDPDERTLERMALAMFAKEGFRETEVFDDPVTGRFRKGPTRALPDNEVYHFSTNHGPDERLHFQMTADGHYVWVDQSGDRRKGHAGEVRRLDLSRLDAVVDTMIDGRTLERMALAILAEMGLHEVTLEDHPLEGMFRRGGSRVLKGEPVYHFVGFNPAWERAGLQAYDYLHFQVTATGRYVRVDEFGNRIEGPAGEVRQLDMSRIDAAAVE